MKIMLKDTVKRTLCSSDDLSSNSEPQSRLMALYRTLSLCVRNAIPLDYPRFPPDTLLRSLLKYKPSLYPDILSF